MFNNKAKSINGKFDDEIEKKLNRLAEVKESADSNSDEPNLVVTSTVTRDNLDSEGNVSGSTIEKREEVLQSQDMQDLKALVALKKDYNSQRNETIQTVVKAGLSLAGVLILLAFEQNHSITTKSLSFFPKPRV